jgi:phosphoribosylformimino-5-aminoimidazole carboxamide ribotide isomerase
MDILPAIDLRSGRCVRLLQGDYNRQIDYADDPVAVAKQFEQAGAHWLHLVDLDGAKEGRPCNVDVAERILANTNLRLEFGGGLRDSASVEALVQAGAARCVIGTKALEDWDWFRELVHRPDFQHKIALGLDARDGKLAVRGWLEQKEETAVELAQRVNGWPLGAIIYTDIAKDGMMSGPNIEATGALAGESSVPVIASGGVTNIEDVRQLSKLPLGGIIIGRALYEKHIDLAEAIRISESS